MIADQGDERCRSLSPGSHPGGPARVIDRRPYESPVGLKMMVPGWPQFSWGQRQRGWVLVGSFAVALAVGLWTWGTWLGWGFFAFAFITQVTSVDGCAPARFVPDLSEPDRAGVRLQRPGIVALSSRHSSCCAVIARPGFEAGRHGSGFLVNCWAYHGDAQAARRPVDLDEASPARANSGPGRVVAVPGQEVEWTGDELARRRARLSAPFDPAYGGAAANLPVQGPVQPDLGRA